MSKGACPLCGRRKARRTCPAKGVSICSVCCGTKRLIEIACPPDCTWLQSASSHPPAVVQRQRERDTHFLVALLHGLTPPQQALTYRLLALLARDRPDLPGLTDADVAEAARALAQTAETASRGIVYQHAAGTPFAQRLVDDMSALVEGAAQQGSPIPDHDLADVFRRIEQGARNGHTVLGNEADDTACLKMLKRLAAALAQEGPEQGTPAQSRESELIIPGR